MDTSVEKIRSVRSRLVRVPLPAPVAWSNVRLDHREYVLVFIETVNGAVGSGFTVGSRFAGGGKIIKDVIDEVLAPVLLDRNSAEIRALWSDMHFQSLLIGRRGACMRAISAVDIALWDLLARRSALPLCKLLGMSRASVPAYASGGYYYHDNDLQQEIRHLVNEVTLAAEKGFTSLKIKIGRLPSHQDRARVDAVLKELGPTVSVAVDANHAWRDAASAVNALRALDELGLWWIEEPVPPDALAASAWLASKLTTPIATGEVESSLMGFSNIISAKAATVIQADVTVVGGITEWQKIAAIAEAADLCLAPHWVPDIHVHLGASNDRVIALEYFDESVGVLNFNAIIQNPLEIVDGMALVPDSPGHGIVFDQASILQYEVV
jgi:L-alanine-DL-glutamate epimerase-like enolase superfamily enzyme